MAAEIPKQPAKRARPLSPHLQIYRWQWTMALSILHRATGVALAVGTLLLVYWLMAAAAGPEYFKSAQGFLKGWIGTLLLLGWSFALFYHLCNGIRHLFWDAGKGFELKTGQMSAGLVLVVAALLSIVAWAIGFGLFR
ncbi:MAG: succinate dehydrogenase, cytochrome b556 subunit [Alphaproteobacteria bacterium]